MGMDWMIFLWQDLLDMEMKLRRKGSDTKVSDTDKSFSDIPEHLIKVMLNVGTDQPTYITKLPPQLAGYISEYYWWPAKYLPDWPGQTRFGLGLNGWMCNH